MIRKIRAGPAMYKDLFGVVALYLATERMAPARKAVAISARMTTRKKYTGVEIVICLLYMMIPANTSINRTNPMRETHSQLVGATFFITSGVTMTLKVTKIQVNGKISFPAPPLLL